MDWDITIDPDREKKQDNSYNNIHTYIYMCMHMTSDAQVVAHRPLTDAQLVPWAVEEREVNSHPLQNSFCMMPYGMEYPFVQFKSAVLILFPPSSLGPSLQMALALYSAINIGV